MNRIIKWLHEVFDVVQVKIECPKCHSIDYDVEIIQIPTLYPNCFENMRYYVEMPLYKCLNCGNKWIN